MACGGLLAAFFLLTLVSYNFQILATIWVYFLLLLEGAEIVYIQVTMQCFTGSQWCNSDTKMQISAVAVFLLFVLIIALRSYCYCPLYETSNPLSMYFINLFQENWQGRHLHLHLHHSYLHSN
jgi:ABC-type phosphate transport system permease subunit